MPPLRGNEARYTAFLLAVLVLFRLWFATTLDLIPDEAYYWLWSKHLDASYFSKGPAVAWTIAAGTKLLGDSVLGIRLFSILLSAGTGWQLFLLARRLFDARTGFYAVVLSSLVPGFAVGGILMTIDPLSVFFWVWAANLFLDALETDAGRDAWQWALCGFAVGSGFLAKFVNLLELLGFLGYALSVPRHRARIVSWRWLLLLATVALCTVPVFWWNAHHGWITTAHLKHRGDLDAGFHFRPGQLVRFVTGQAMILSPLIFIALLIAAGAVLLRRTKTEAEKYLLALFLPTFGLYLLLSFNEGAEGNWTVTSFPAGLLLAVVFWGDRARGRDGRGIGARIFVAASLAVALLVTALLHGPSLPFLKPRKDPLLRGRGWETLAAKLQEVQSAHPQAFLIADNYGLASEAAFYLPRHPVTFVPRSDHPENQFSFWPSYASSVNAGAPALYLTGSDSDTLPDVLRSDFRHAEVVDTVWREAVGKRIASYRVWLLTN